MGEQVKIKNFSQILFKINLLLCLSIFLITTMKSALAADYISIYTVVFHPGQNLEGNSLFEWDFNSDGIIDSTNVDGSYIFPGPGTYSVKLTTTSNLGIKNIISRNITISEGATPPPPPPIPTNWMNSGWKGRVKLTIASGKVDTNLTDFPVYVNLADLGTTHNFWTKAKTDCRDIRVTKADGITELPREVIDCSVANKKGELYFKAQGTLSSSVGNDFYIYYGNPVAGDYIPTDAFGRENVWDANFKGVWHMNQEPISTNKIIDSTASHADMQPTGSMTSSDLANGYIGKAINFNSVNNTYLISTNNNLNLNTNFTISAMAKLSAIGTSARSVVDWGEPALAKRRGILMRDNETMCMTLNVYSDQGSNYLLSQGNWVHITGTVTSTSVVGLYINGLIDNISSNPNPSAAAFNYSAGTKIGANINGGEPWYGLIDEVRISNIVRSASWIKAEYSNLFNSASFYSFAIDESI
jgi:PKD repeat protein